MTVRRLAICVSHPIQHFVSFYRALAAEPGIELQVIFGAPIGMKRYFDAEMQTEITWNIDSTGGYSHQFLEADQGNVQPRFMAPNSKKVGAALSAFRPDAVIIYGYGQINNLRALAWCTLNRVPAMMIGDSELLQYRSPAKQALRKLVLPRILARFSAYLSVGDANELYYRSFGAHQDRIFRVPFTIDETSYMAAAANRDQLRATRRAALGIPEDAFVALFVGKLSARKRPLDLAEAIQLLSKTSQDRPIHALFAGNGEELTALTAARDQGLPIHLPGFINVDILPSYYAAADLLVHPSQADPHPLICSEAACIGLPMLLTDKIGAAGPTDIARPGKNAEIFSVGDVDALAGLIAKLANDYDLTARMAAQSQAIYAECNMAASVAGVNAALAHVTR